MKRIHEDALLLSSIDVIEQRGAVKRAFQRRNHTAYQTTEQGRMVTQGEINTLRTLLYTHNLLENYV